MTAADFFVDEARGCLRDLRDLLRRDVDAGALRPPVRRLRGSAQMASQGEALRAAAALEAAVRAADAGTIPWDASVRGTLTHAIADLERVVESGSAAFAEQVVERITALGAEPAAGDPTRAVAERADDAFPAFVRAEIASIRDALSEAAAATGGGSPAAAPLHDLLDRQAALAGSARLAELPVVARALEAADHITRALLAGTATDHAAPEAYRVIGAVLGEAPLAPRVEAPELQARIERARSSVSPSGADDGDVPVEVANFFRTEARAELNRAAQLASDAAEQRTATAADRLRAGLDALATTASTFGFAGVAQRLHDAVQRTDGVPPGSLPAAVDALRKEVLGALGEDAPSGPPDAAAAARGGPPPPIVTAGGEDEEDAGYAVRAGGAENLEVDADGAVPISTLCYAGAAALERAAALRAEWEAADGPAARSIAEEVFDLIDLARR
ncbi:MAG TPA: hypothetical protein VK837_12670 [Longimicrobiales bacterium]|nr:hypothetical protein [Longimicrobiales bacterium]